MAYMDRHRYRAYVTLHGGEHLTSPLLCTIAEANAWIYGAVACAAAVHRTWSASGWKTVVV